MLKMLAVSAVALSLSHLPAAAEEKMVVDMSKITRGEFTKLGFQDFAGITMCLSGYYNAGVRNTVIDLHQFAHAAKTEGFLPDQSAGDGDVGRRTGARH